MIADRTKAWLTQFIRRVTKPLEYSGKFTYTVVVQRDDGSLELKTDYPEEAPDLSKIAIWYGDPGTNVKVDPGARCAVEFLNKKPDAPVVTSWLHSKANTLVLMDGTKPVARVGDPVLSSTPLTGVLIMPGLQAGPFPVLGSLILQGPLLGIVQKGNTKILG